METQQEIGIVYNSFTHTATLNHARVAQGIFTRLLELDYLYSKRQQQFHALNFAVANT
ncbi:MAG TPA: class I tRNA ligase family protein [Thermoflexia bacterium]|nr:class I tRNA ligase family protein [Thermoflexia bacterium]